MSPAPKIEPGAPELMVCPKCDYPGAFTVKMCFLDDNGVWPLATFTECPVCGWNPVREAARD